ncbi:hypothetical protein MMC29_000968 [Sticta canariensis]|nr:hypothetical protein [Sticta canariensis]
MGFGIGKLWRGLMLREKDKNVRQTDLIFDESHSHREPVIKNICNAASICTGGLEAGPESTVRQIASTLGTSIKSLHPSLDHHTEGQRLITIDSASGSHEDVKTAIDLGQTRLIDRPHPLRQARHDPILPQQPITLRIKSAVKIDRGKAFYGTTSSNSGDVHQSETASTVHDDSFENSVNQNGESYAGLCLPEETPETEHSPTLEPDNEVLEEVEISPSYVQDEEDSPDCASTKSSNNRAWEQYVRMLEKSQENELEDLREELEALKAEHQQDLDTANSRKIVLQKRVKKLLEQNEKAAIEHDESYLKLRTAQIKAEFLEGQLAQSRESNRVVAQHLQKALRDGEYYWQKTRELNYALEQEPGKYADVEREIKIRDERFSDQEQKTRDYIDETNELLEMRRKAQEAACTEASDLRTKLEKASIDIACLKASKADFQHQSEAVFEMLAGRIVPSDLFAAMNDYVQLVIKDNEILKSKVEEQILEISGKNDKIQLLDFEKQSLEKQALSDRETHGKLEYRIREQDIEIGQLEFKINSDAEEHLGEIEDKDAQIADLEAKNEELSHENDTLVRGDSICLRRLIRSKNLEIAQLNTNLGDLEAEKSELEEKLRVVDQQGEAAVVTYLAEMESDELRIRLRSTTEELTELRRQVHAAEAQA